MGKYQIQKIKSLIFGFFLLLMSGVLVGCGKGTPQISVQEYNNQLISYQSQALDALDEYLSRLKKEYDGKNLHQLYEELKTEITSIKTQALAQSGRKEDFQLRNAVVDYLSGLEATLEENEKPIVELVDGYTGALKSFYQEERGKIGELTLIFSKKLAHLDDELAQQQAVFSHRHGYALE